MAAAAIDPGPRPSWQQAVSLGNAALVEQLKDPQSALVAWPWTFFGGELGGGMFGKKQAGWITCGVVNAKNMMGGYSGAVPFVIVIRGGAVAELEIGAPDGVDGATPTCREMIAKGRVHPSGASSVPAPIQ